jgi:hypothetical protein
MKCNLIFPPPPNYGCGERGMPDFTVILINLWDNCKVLKNDCTNFFNFVCVFLFITILTQWMLFQIILPFAQVMYNLKIQLSFNNKTANRSEAHNAIGEK